jgi:hypothetical protein
MPNTVDEILDTILESFTAAEAEFQHGYKQTRPGLDNQTPVAFSFEPQLRH